MKGEYLLLMLVVLGVPLVYSFDKRLGLYRHATALMKTLILVCTGYWAWDIIATARGHWAFNPAYTLGIIIVNLPLEEMFFFVVISFVSIFSWEVVKYVAGKRRM